MQGEGIVVFNLVCYALTCIGLAVLVMSPRIKDGVIIKFGLIAMTLGFFFRCAGIFDGLIYGLDRMDVVYLSRSNAVINGGLIVVVIGYLVRTKAGAKKQRRRTDWMDIEDAPSVDRRAKS